MSDPIPFRFLQRIGRFFLIAICIPALLALQACPGGSTSQVNSAASGSKSTVQSSSSIEQFLNSYFSTWSEGDIAAYKAHFDPAATIKYVEDGHVVMSDGLSEFIDMQTRFIAAANPGTHEDMTSYEVHSQDGVVWVRANWVLEQGSIQTRGVDQFTLLQDESGAWKIISLVFYEYKD